MPALPIFKSELNLNINEKHPAFSTKISSNCTPLDTISNNDRVKYSIIKFLKQQHIDEEVK